MLEEKPNFTFDPQTIPTEPGCYLFYDQDEEIIYVGKAKNLRKRTSSYFQKTKKSPKTESLVKKICRIETRTVTTEMEALILENTLIKQHKPKYNILLRDDKTFLYLRVTNESEPKLELTRRLVRDGSTYIGPRTSSKSFRQTIAFCQKFFGVKMVNASQDNYVSKLKGKAVSLTDYQDNIRRMKKFLRGDTQEVIGEIKNRMMEFAKMRNFEAAAKMRDLLSAIDTSTKRQTIEFAGDFTPRDFVHFHRDGNKAYFVRMVFRNGKFVDLNEIKFRAEEFSTDAELVGQFLLQFYPQVDTLPKEIFVPVLPEDLETVVEFLQTPSPPCQGEPKIERRDVIHHVFVSNKHAVMDEDAINGVSTNTEEKNQKLIIHVPERGDKRKVLEIAAKNAQNFAAKAHINALSQAENFAKALPELTEKLGLAQPIRRIECYDISHFSGQQTVASQVTFIDGQPYKNAYRRYKIESLKPGEIDDFASMQEVLGRRFARLLSEIPPTPLSKEGRCLQIENGGIKTEQKQPLDKKLVDPGSSISIKPVETSEDWQYYHTFGRALFVLHRPDIEYHENHPDLTKEKNHPFLILNQDKPIGFFRLDEKGATRIILRTLFITESARNNGLGTQVLSLIEQWCLERAKKSLVVNAHKEAFNFYEKNGFKNKFWKGDSTNEDCVPMGKKLTQAKADKNIPEYPDLIVIDGGKGQLSSVLKILDPIMQSVSVGANGHSPLQHFDITKNVIALAKREEEVFRGVVNAKGKVEFEQLDIQINSAPSKLLQRARDEAHRFAISFNRNLRAKSAMKSVLDEIPGIGGQTKKKLLQTFGSVSGIRAAGDDDLLAIVNQKQLNNLRKQL